MPSFYRWGNWGFGKLTDWLTAIMMVNHKSEEQHWLPSPVLFSGISISLLPSVVPTLVCTAQEVPVRRDLFLLTHSEEEPLLGKSPAQRCWVDLSKGPNELTWFQNWKTPDLLPAPCLTPHCFHPLLLLPLQNQPAEEKQTIPISLTSYWHCLCERDSYLHFSSSMKSVKPKTMGTPADSAASPAKHISEHVLIGK